MSYSKEQIKKALELYQQYKSVSETVRILGYPSREYLYKWIKNSIKRCFELGESVKYVAKDIGYTRATIYQWRKKISFERKNSINK